MIRILLDADLSSRSLTRILSEAGHDVRAAGLERSISQADDRTIFAIAQGESRVMVTHNCHDFPEILREWAEAGRSHAGCVISCVPTNQFGEMERRFRAWFDRFPDQAGWIDRAVFL